MPRALRDSWLHQFPGYSGGIWVRKEETGQLLSEDCSLAFPYFNLKAPFVVEESEAQRGLVPCPRSHSQVNWVTGSVFEASALMCDSTAATVKRLYDGTCQVNGVKIGNDTDIEVGFPSLGVFMQKR